MSSGPFEDPDPFDWRVTVKPRPPLPEGTPRCLGEPPCVRPAGHSGRCIGPESSSPEPSGPSRLPEDYDELLARLKDAEQQLEVLRPGGLYAWKSKYEALQAEVAGGPSRLRALELAEVIVREYGSLDCAGHSQTYEPYCTAAPGDYPLCKECAALKSAIVEALVGPVSVETKQQEETTDV